MMCVCPSMLEPEEIKKLRERMIERGALTCPCMALLLPEKKEEEKKVP